MKLEILMVFFLSALRLTFGQPEVVECVRNLKEMESHFWRGLYTLRYAEDSSELPGAMHGAIDGNGIFYAVGSSGGSYQRFYKPLEHFLDIKPAYIYVKYYAHVENVTSQRIYAFPSLNGTYDYLPHATDFTWREALVELNVNSIIGRSFDANAAAGADLLIGDFLLVDEMILVQGVNISNISEVKDLCPPEIEPTVPTTSTTTTEKPTDSILECIDEQQDFNLNGWSSYPPHKYAHNSSSLPGNLGSLTGQGIFYFNELPPIPHHVFYKDYSSEFQGESGPTYIYLKYYVQLATNDSQAAYIQPVKLVPGQHSFELNSSEDFLWQEKLLEIDTQNPVVGSLVEIGIFDIQPGELLLIDKIIVSRGRNLAETLQQLTSCL